MSDLKLQISKQNKYQSNNLPSNLKKISKVSNKYKRINIPHKEYNKKYINSFKKKNYRIASPYLKFLPFENQEFFVNSKGNFEYICHNEDYKENENDFYQNNSDFYLHKGNFVDLHNYEVENQNLKINKVYQIYYSNEILNTQPNTCKKIVKYLSPEPKNENHKKVRYKSKYENMENDLKSNTYNNSNEKIITNMKTNNTTVNIYSNNVGNISNSSYKNEQINSNINSRYSNLNRKYLYNNEMLNSSKNQIKKRNTTTKLFLFKNNRDYTDIEDEFRKSKSFDGKNLKMQNSQNLQIIQDEKLYQILLPIAPNEIDYNCNFQIPKDNLRRRNKNIIDSSNTKNEQFIDDNINEKENNNNQEKINNNLTYSKKRIKKNKINKEDFTINKFSLSIKETGRKFQDEMKIVNTDLNYYEGKSRNWNDIIKPNNEPNFTIERQINKGKNLSENKVEKFCYKGKIKNNWNTTNNKQLMDNICFYKNKNLKKINLHQQKNVFFTINGVGKNWNNNLVNTEEINVILTANIDENKKINKKEKMSEYELSQKFSDEEIIVNPKYMEDKSKINKEYLYRQSITNKLIFKKNKKEYEFGINTEGSSNNEENQKSEYSSPQNKMRNEYREQIILSNPKYEGNISIRSKNNFNNNFNRNSEILVEENEMSQSESNKSNIYRSQKLHVEYIFKKDFNSSINNYKDEKSKTFLKQMKYGEVKKESSVDLDYNINFPDPDQLNQYQRESESSNLTENLGALKENIENINIHNSNKVINDNNLNKQFFSKHLMRITNNEN